MIKYAQMAKNLLKDFDYDLQRIPKEENGQANALAKLVSAKVVVNNRTVIQETLQEPCTNRVMNVEESESWMSPIVNYLKGESYQVTKRSKDGRVTGGLFLHRK